LGDFFTASETRRTAVLRDQNRSTVKEQVKSRFEVWGAKIPKKRQVQAAGLHSNYAKSIIDITT